MRPIVRHVVAAVALAAAALVEGTPAGAGAARVGDLVIGAAWLREPPPGANVAAGYLTIANEGAASDTLIGVAAPFARTAQIHETAQQGGMMTMRPVEDLVIPAGETVALRPGALHLMFMGLAAPPAAGEAVSVTLTFQNAGRIEVTLDVGGIAAQGPPRE